MKAKSCLYCYAPLPGEDGDFHHRCSKKFFGQPRPPLLDYTQAELGQLAKKVVQERITVPGAQAKLWLSMEDGSQKNQPSRLTIVGLWGHYILKPATMQYPHLPELEDLTMHMGEAAGMTMVPHTLIRLHSGELAYLTKRVDRDNTQKYHMEDMCQITHRLTEEKYRGSYEQIAKAIAQHSAFPGLDLQHFYQQVIFAFLTGNNDMHFKNFSLLKEPQHYYRLSPAYDHLAATLVVEGDDEELALTLNGKKRKLKRLDFDQAMSRAKIPPKVSKFLFQNFAKSLESWHRFIDQSFLPTSLQEAYHQLLKDRAQQLAL